MTQNLPSTLPSSYARQGTPWYRPTVSPEHGVYVVLFSAFLTGAAAAQHWTWATTLALICAYCGFQAEHPIALQIKQRSSWKPRLLVWAGLYGGITVAIAIGLVLWQPQGAIPLLLLYGLATLVTVVDGVSVWQRRQKSIANELATFFAVCLSAPLAYLATLGQFAPEIVALWLLNGLFFSSAIFTVKLRKPKHDVVTPGLVFHGVALGLLGGLVLGGWLSLVAASTFGIAILKFLLGVWQKERYCQAPIKNVALFETLFSLGFLVALSLLLWLGL